jgi:hypothetical protein
VTTKTDFTPEAWQAILAAPGAIGTLVMNASFGLGDMIKEAERAQQADRCACAAARRPAAARGAGRRLQAAAGSRKGAGEPNRRRPRPPRRRKQDPAAQKAQLLAGVQAAVAAVDATATPEEAAQLKQWLYGVGDAVAKAAKEGDFFGIGGKQVSDAEAAVLVEIKTALGL